MTHSIAVLRAALDTARHNEPIFRTEGKHEAADRVHADAHSLEVAIHNLELVLEGTFDDYLRRGINHHSLEAGSDTPDFILAEYLRRCLENFDLTMQHRATWFEPQDGAEDVVPLVETPSQEYRMLKVGETISRGDECCSGGQWFPTVEATWDVKVMAYGLREEAFRNVGYYRRPL
jgi:hypothetical protein